MGRHAQNADGTIHRPGTHGIKMRKEGKRGKDLGLVAAYAVATLEMVRQEDCYKCKASLGYLVRLCLKGKHQQTHKAMPKILISI